MCSKLFDMDTFDSRLLLDERLDKLRLIIEGSWDSNWQDIILEVSQVKELINRLNEWVVKNEQSD